MSDQLQGLKAALVDRYAIREEMGAALDAGEYDEARRQLRPVGLPDSIIAGLVGAVVDDSAVLAWAA